VHAVLQTPKSPHPIQVRITGPTWKGVSRRRWRFRIFIRLQMDAACRAQWLVSFRTPGSTCLDRGASDPRGLGTLPFSRVPVRTGLGVFNGLLGSIESAVSIDRLLAVCSSRIRPCALSSF
jgi:hypothetical protein